jgi:hypothetical protein
VYVDLEWVEDVTPWIARGATVDLAPGPGGSRITPIGPVAVGRRHGRGAYVSLEPSSQLVAHCDPPIVGVRVHLPLVVNPGCWAFHLGVWQRLDVGRVYLMDPTKPHGAVNWGTTRRLHLMVDLED